MNTGPGDAAALQLSDIERRIAAAGSIADRIDAACVRPEQLDDLDNVLQLMLQALARLRAAVEAPVCEACGKVIEGSERKTRRYCGNRCRQAAHRARNARRPVLVPRMHGPAVCGHCHYVIIVAGNGMWRRPEDGSQYQWHCPAGHQVREHAPALPGDGPARCGTCRRRIEQRPGGSWTHLRTVAGREADADHPAARAT